MHVNNIELPGYTSGPITQVSRNRVLTKTIRDVLVGNNLPRAVDAVVDAHHSGHQKNAVDGMLKAFLELGECDAGCCCIPRMRIQASTIQQGVVGSTLQGFKEYIGRTSSRGLVEELYQLPGHGIFKM
jgi:hypothetical protein